MWGLVEEKLCRALEISGTDWAKLSPSCPTITHIMSCTISHLTVEEEGLLNMLDRITLLCYLTHSDL
jgi:hypothetical protein